MSLWACLWASALASLAAIIAVLASAARARRAALHSRYDISVHRAVAVLGGANSGCTLVMSTDLTRSQLPKQIWASEFQALEPSLWWPSSPDYSQTISDGNVLLLPRTLRLCQLSRRCLGLASDLNCPGMKLDQFFQAIVSIPEFHGIGLSGECNYIHVDIWPTPRIRWWYRKGRERSQSRSTVRVSFVNRGRPQRVTPSPRWVPPRSDRTPAAQHYTREVTNATVFQVPIHGGRGLNITSSSSVL